MINVAEVIRKLQNATKEQGKHLCTIGSIQMMHEIKHADTPRKYTAKEEERLRSHAKQLAAFAREAATLANWLELGWNDDIRLQSEK